MKYIFVCNILENIYLQFYMDPSLVGHFTTSTTFTLTILSNFWTLSNIPSIWILSTTYLICKFLYGPYVLLYIALYMLHGLHPSYTLFICWGVGIVLLSKSSCCFDTINTCSPLSLIKGTVFCRFLRQKRKMSRPQIVFLNNNTSSSTNASFLSK